jgi:Ribbon-helix-helix protein, copG family
LTPEHFIERISQMAAERGISVAELIREALEERLLVRFALYGAGKQSAISYQLSAISHQLSEAATERFVVPRAPWPRERELCQATIKAVWPLRPCALTRLGAVGATCHLRIESTPRRAANTLFELNSDPPVDGSQHVWAGQA